jgi:DNA-binding CsgD family transcriptional regulator
MGTDVVGVIEAAYRASADDVDWLRTITEFAAPDLDEDGLGVLGAYYALDADDRLTMDRVVQVGMKADLLEAVLRSNQSAPPAMNARLFRSGPVCGSGSSLSRLDRRIWLAAFADNRTPPGVFDGVGVVSGSSDGTGCVLIAPKRKFGPATRFQRDVWSRIAAHLGAALRLRIAAPPPEAVLSPSGRVEHAEPGARDVETRQALSRGVKRIERARGPVRRRAPSEAVALWRALVDGRWSLVDHFDHDGRRFLVARRNAPALPALGRLSPREVDVVAHAAMGHSNKFIGYQLGLSASGVAMNLLRAARKLRVRSRVALIAAYRRESAA